MRAVVTAVAPMQRHMDWHDDRPHWWGITLMILLFLALVGVIVWAVVTVTRGNRASNGAPPAAPPGAPPGSSARRILDERFARGEIDGDEYEQRRRLLDG